MNTIFALLLAWFFISIPVTFFVGAVLGLAKKTRQDESSPVVHQNKNLAEAVQ